MYLIIICKSKDTTKYLTAGSRDRQQQGECREKAEGCEGE